MLLPRPAPATRSGLPHPSSLMAGAMQDADVDLLCLRRDELGTLLESPARSAALISVS